MSIKNYKMSKNISLIDYYNGEYQKARTILEFHSYNLLIKKPKLYIAILLKLNE